MKRREDEANGMAVVDRLLREHGVIRPEEAWVHGMWTLGKWRACIIAKLKGKKLVRMTHGSLSPIYLERQGKWKKRLVSPIERLCFWLADRVVVTCEAEKVWCRKWGLRGEIEVVDLKRFFRLEKAKSEVEVERRNLHVLYLGRRHPLKGVEYLERAVAEIKGERPLSTSTFDLDLRVVSDHFGDELERDWDWCDVLVLPTLSENFGLVVAEALERGKRVITTDGAPAWEPEEGKEEKGKAKKYGGRLVYLRGFRDGTDEERVRLLKEAIAGAGAE